MQECKEYNKIIFGVVAMWVLFAVITYYVCLSNSKTFRLKNTERVFVESLNTDSIGERVPWHVARIAWDYSIWKKLWSHNKAKDIIPGAGFVLGAHDGCYVIVDYFGERPDGVGVEIYLNSKQSIEVLFLKEEIEFAKRKKRKMYFYDIVQRWGWEECPKILKHHPNQLTAFRIIKADGSKSPPRRLVWYGIWPGEKALVQIRENKRSSRQIFTGVWFLYEGEIWLSARWVTKAGFRVQRVVVNCLGNSSIEFKNFRQIKDFRQININKEYWRDSRGAQLTLDRKERRQVWVWTFFCKLPVADIGQVKEGTKCFLRPILNDSHEEGEGDKEIVLIPIPINKSFKKE